MPVQCASVLLLHALPDGTSHFDWLIEPEPGTQLISFRIHKRIDQALPERLDAQRLPDHRRLYLDFEGPISDNRGTVTRLASGTHTGATLTKDALRITINWGDQTISYEANRIDQDRWHVSAFPET